MEQQRMYFMLNKEQDYERCYLSGMEYKNGQLLAHAAMNRMDIKRVAMISRIFDSHESDTDWHRLRIYDLFCQDNASFSILFYASNELIRIEHGEEVYVPEQFYKEEFSIEDKLKWMRPYFVKQTDGQADILLHEVRGRYFWFVIVSELKQGQSLRMGNMQIYFPRDSFLKYLPEVYQREDKNQFFERFLAIFGTTYEELNDEIYNYPNRLDVPRASVRDLRLMAEWLGIDDYYMWSDDQLRVILKEILRLCRYRGTRQAMIEYLKIYTGGVAPLIVENHELKKGEDPYHKLGLYPDDAYRFYVLLPEEVVKDKKDYHTLLRLIEEAKPVNMEVDLVVLKPYIFLDGHSYLGINTSLKEYGELSLDGAAMVSFSMVAQGQPLSEQTELQ